MEVTIDDRLPCLGGKLCFSQCQTEDLFWLPLLEKAYAKYVSPVTEGNEGRWNILSSLLLASTSDLA